MGRFSSQQIFSFEAKKCGCSLFAADQDFSCCKDESELVKVEDDHTTVSPSSATVALAAAVAVLVYPASAWTLQGAAQRLSPAGVGHAPPRAPVPLYQLFSSLRFFDDGEPSLA
jgi:hypothetical protein